MTKDELLNSGLLEEYVLGLCDNDTRVKIETLASNDPEIADVLQTMQSGMKNYCRKSRAQSNSPDGASAAASMQQFWKAGFVSAAILATVFVLLTVHFYSKTQTLRSENGRLIAAITSERDSWENQSQEVAERLSLHRMITHEKTRHIQLVSLDHQREANCMVYWNDLEQSAIMQVFRLSPPPDGWCYKIWADSAGNMIDMGMIKMSKPWHPLPFIPNIQSLNVTLERQVTTHQPSFENLFCKAKI